MSKIDLRAFVEPQEGATYEQQLVFALAAEKAGYNAFFRSDHYLAMRTNGIPGPTDAWVSLGALARETSSIRLGTLVTSNTFRDPARLAIIAAQVDDMSKGRLDFGLGAGWYEAEHAAYGIAFPDTKERFDRLAEALEIITGLWKTPPGQDYNYHGKYYDLVDSPALPKPYQGSNPPIIIGGKGKIRTPALAAKYADEFNVPFSTLEETKAILDCVASAVAQQRARALIPSVALVVCIGETDAKVTERAEFIGRDVSELKSAGLAGTPQEVQDKIGAFQNIGINRFYGQFLNIDDLDQVNLLQEIVQGI